MGHLQRLSNWNVRRAITRHRTAQVLDAISYYKKARAQSDQPKVYDGILSQLASLAEISELTEGVSMLNVSENSEEQLRQLRHAFRSLRTECSLIDGDVPVHVPLLAALVSAPTSVNPAAAEAEPPADRPIGQGAVGALPQFPQLEGPPGAPREVVAAPQLPQHRAAPTPAAPTPAAPSGYCRSDRVFSKQGILGASSPYAYIVIALARMAFENRRQWLTPPR